jgi:hypothetical protein
MQRHRQRWMLALWRYGILAIDRPSVEQASHSKRSLLRVPRLGFASVTSLAEFFTLP